MKYVWDRRKCRDNVRKHGIDFADVSGMFERPMVTFLDCRRDYGED